jgi:hypothetical protein
MALFDKTTDITQFDWKKKVGDSGKTNQDNLPANSTANKKLEDRLDEVKAIYNENGGNKALRGDNNLGFDAPFIVKDIGDSYDSANLDDGIARGGVALQLVRAAEDVVRLGKFTLTPRGILWNLKQAILQKQNPIKKNRTFNPLSTIASSAPTVHMPRHFNFPNILETPKYEDNRDEGRLVGLQKGLDPLPEPPSEESGTPTPPESPSLFDKLKDAGKSLLGFDGEHFIDPVNNTNSRGAKTADTMVKSDNMKEGKLAKNELGDREDDGIGNVNVTNFTIGLNTDSSKQGLGSGKIRVGGTAEKPTIYAKGITNELQVPYGGTYGQLNIDKLPKDFIKFRIRDAVNGKWLVFPAHLGTITDTVSPEYSQERYIGRPDAVHVYTGTNRNVTFDFKVAAFTKQEIPIIQEKMNYLIGLGYPHYKNYGGDGEMRPVAPYIYLTIGDLFNNTPGYFNSISCTIEETSTWELDEGFQIPQYWNVSVDFVYIGKYLPHSLSKHYEVPHLKDSGIKTDTFGTFGKNNPTDGSTKRPIMKGKPKWSEGLK